MKVRPALAKSFETPLHARHMEASCTQGSWSPQSSIAAAGRAARVPAGDAQSVESSDGAQSVEDGAQSGEDGGQSGEDGAQSGESTQNSMTERLTSGDWLPLLTVYVSKYVKVDNLCESS
jgi:hypothetical protein